MEAQACTTVPMPGGELVLYVPQKYARDGDYTRDASNA